MLGGDEDLFMSVTDSNAAAVPGGSRLKQLVRVQSDSDVFVLLFVVAGTEYG